MTSPPKALHRKRISSETQERLVLIAGLAWGAVIWALAIGDVIAQRPPRPPTPAEVAAGRPRAEAKWRVVRAMLVGRLDQPNPLEFGAVWSTRTGVFCGLVNGWGSFGGLTGMTRFIAVNDAPTFVDDAPNDQAAQRFDMQWLRCRSDPWIVLHGGSADTGFCATRWGRRRCTESAPADASIKLQRLPGQVKTPVSKVVRGR
jgi:hypothetical protein